ATHAQAIAALAPELELVAYTGSRGLPTTVPDGVPRATEAELLRSDADLIVIATPSNLHGEQALAAIAAGKGVVVEKPIATTAAQGRELVGAWRRAAVFGAAIAQRRLEPQHLAIKALLDSGELGVPRLAEVSVCWWRSPEYYAQAPWRALPPGGGVLMNQALHNVDLLVWLLGEADQVAALTGNLAHDLRCEDTAVAAVRMKSGALATITASTAAPPGRAAGLRLYTDRGYVALDHSSIVEWEFPGIEPPAVATAAVSGAGDPSAIGVVGHLAQWRDIAEAIAEGRQPAVTLADGLASIELIDAIYRASDGGTTVRVGAES
ncbi:MAG: Gfo/Idh/MocA family oxidoreductase, partial [Propionicimonas sp.]